MTEKIIPDGYKLVAVKGLDELVYWLERCKDKGHLENCADLIEPFEAFEYRNVSEEAVIAAHEAKAAPAVPFGYFRAEPFGWTDCAATDEGAIALYERPAAPAAPAAPDVMSILRAIHRRPSDAGIWLDDITRILRDAPAPAVPSVLKRGYGRLIQAAADLALQQFMPSDIVDDYPSKTISAAKVAKMMTQPRDRLRLLSIEVSEGAKQMLAATPAAPSQPVTRPQNCGTSFCSCIECVCEPSQEPLTNFDAIPDEVIDTAQEKSGMYRVELMRAWDAIIAALREKESGK